MRVQLFGPIRERLGSDVVEVSGDGVDTVGGLLDRLAADYPELASYRASVRLAVDQRIVDEGARLDGASELALIPPVSGG